ncbi:MAG: glycosyltransferase [Planctomycetes bacterium]|nr:glycosyltransferase [Planctomycetota bacterium]
MSPDVQDRVLADAVPPSLEGGPSLRVLIHTHAVSRHADDYPQYINQLALAYQEAGHRVEVLAASHRGIDPSRLDPRLVFRFYRYAPRRWECLGYGRSMELDLRVGRTALALAPLLLASGALAVRRAVLRFRPDLVHAHFILPNGLVAALGTLGLGVPLLVSMPGNDVTAMGQHASLGRLGAWTARRAMAVTTNSDDLLQAAVRAGVPRERLRIVLYGSDVTTRASGPGELEALRARLGLDPDERVVLAVGRMVPKKGFSTLVEALPCLDRLLAGRVRYRAVLVGDGPLLEPLRERSRALGVAGRAVFPGRVDYRELPGYYLLAHALAMPAVREPADGLNVVVTEAMKYGLPIAATAVGGNELVVAEGVNGHLCPERDPAALAGALARLLLDPERARAMGRASRRIFRRRASWPRIVDQYVAIARAGARP